MFNIIIIAMWYDNGNNSVDPHAVLFRLRSVLRINPCCSLVGQPIAIRFRSSVVIYQTTKYTYIKRNPLSFNNEIY